jgi:hypothetical protein
MATKLKGSEDWYRPNFSFTENEFHEIQTDFDTFAFHCRNVFESSAEFTVAYGKLFDTAEEEVERHDYGWRVIVINKEERRAAAIFLKDQILSRHLSEENRKIITPFFKINTCAPENYLFV